MAALCGIQGLPFTLALGHWDRAAMSVPGDCRSPTGSSHVGRDRLVGRSRRVGRISMPDVRLMVQNDFGNVLINWFESLVGQWMKQPARICTLAEVCRRALAVEKDGSLYPCDDFVYPECRLGDLRDKNRELADVAYSPSNEGSAAASTTSCPTTADTARIASPATATVPRIDSSRPPTASPDSVTFVPPSSDF